MLNRHLHNFATQATASAHLIVLIGPHVALHTRIDDFIQPRAFLGHGEGGTVVGVRKQACLYESKLGTKAGPLGAVPVWERARLVWVVGYATSVLVKFALADRYPHGVCTTAHTIELLADGLQY